MPYESQGATLEDHARAKIAKYLPAAIDRAIQSYREFYDQESPEKSRDFSAYHSACKAAIAHIELLLKLAAWARLPRENEGEDQTLAQLMAQAQNELDQYQEDDDE